MARTMAGNGVLVVASGGLGDAVLLAHVFSRFAALARPGERVSLLLRRDAGKMAFLFEGSAEVQTVDYDRFAHSFLFRRKTIREIGHARWRLIVNTDFLRHPKRDEALIKALRADEKVAMVPRGWAKYDSALEKNKAIYARLFDSGPVHLDKVLRWVHFADFLTGTNAPTTRLRFADEHVPPPAQTTRPIVLLIPFSAVREKQASPDLFAKIARAVPDTYDVIVPGAPDDPHRNPDYAALLSLPRVRFEACDFIRLASLARAARLVISVDTAAMHLAVGVGAPTLCLASAAYVGEIVPYAPEIAPPNAHFIFTPMACAGCLGHCILPLEENVYACVARLPRASIVDEVKRLMAETVPA